MQITNFSASLLGKSLLKNCENKGLSGKVIQRYLNSIHYNLNELTS